MSIFYDFYHGIVSKFYPIKPVGVIFDVTNKCNAKCVMCNIWRQPPQDLSLSIFLHLIKSPLFKNIRNVVVTGGEPCLRSDLPNLFSHLIQNLPKLNSFNITTNALLPNKLEKTITQILEIRDREKLSINLITQISLDGLGELHSEIRGVPNAFQKVEKSIKTMQKICSHNKLIDYYFLCVIQPKNIHLLDQLDLYFKSTGKPVTYNIICEANYMNSSKSNTLLLSEKELEIVKKFLTEIIVRSNDPRRTYHYQEILGWLNSGVRAPCGLLTQHIVVSSSGEILPCLNCGSYQYNYKEFSDLVGFWKSSHRKIINKSIVKNQCPSCRTACGPNTYDAFKALLFEGLTHFFSKKSP